MRLAAGTVVRFDETRGYGFIAPDDGGEDVFMHANSLVDDKHEFVPGAPVQFEVADGERGLKALSVRLRRRENTDPAPQASPPVRAASQADDEDGLCDVLTRSAFTQQLTETLLTTVPTLTAAQIVQLRSSLVAFAGRHGWVEG